MSTTVQTWHYGLVARWWAEFNREGPEIPYFQRVIEQYGQPALDVGCGTGRLLVPYLRAGLDVDGVDVSEDMLACCRTRAAAEGLSPRLYARAMHELDLPRKYRTIVVCGTFGIGGNRANDMQTLRRFHDLLEPGGVLALDHYLPYRNGDGWQLWTRSGRETLPQPWPEATPLRETSDGSALRLRVRVANLDPLQQVIALEMWAEEFRDGEAVREEKSLLLTGMYFCGELVMMLQCAGFDEIDVRAAYEDRPATMDDEIVVITARK